MTYEELYKNMIDIENFYPIGGHPLYHISKDGRVLSFNNYHYKKKPAPYFVSPDVNGGYKRIIVKGRKILKHHRILAKAFIPNPENKPDINHIDGNRGNNSLDNLEWVTPKENSKHAAIVLNKNIIGENNPKAKLTSAQVLEIRGILKTEKRCGCKLAKRFGVTPTIISSIKQNKIWRHI